MNNYSIDWENLSAHEANDILIGISSKFNLTVKCPGLMGIRDVGYLIVNGPYNDCFESVITMQECAL